MMKKRKSVSTPAIPLKIESHPIQNSVRRTTLLLIASVCLFVGFILGSTVAILKTSKATKIAGPSEESQRGASVDREGEVKLLKTALEKDPNDLPTLIELGNVYFDSDRHQEAIDVYSKALALDPQNPDVRTDMGIMCRKLGQFDKAIEAFRKAAQDQPMHANSRFNLGVVLKYDKNDLKGAIQAWEEFLKLVSPDDKRIPMVKTEIQDMKPTLNKK